MISELLVQVSQTIGALVVRLLVTARVALDLEGLGRQRFRRLHRQVVRVLVLVTPRRVRTAPICRVVSRILIETMIRTVYRFRTAKLFVRSIRARKIRLNLTLIAKRLKPPKTIINFDFLNQM